MSRSMRYSHVYSIAFVVESNHDADHVPADEILAAMHKRAREITEAEILEAALCEETDDAFDPV